MGTYEDKGEDLSEQGLKENGLVHIDSDQVREMDSVKYIPQLREVRKAVGKNQVKVKEHFKFFI